MLVHSSKKISIVASLCGIFILVMSCLSACGSQSSGNGSQAPIKIGASIPTSGDFATDGKALRQGYELWADHINKSGGLLGRQVSMDFKADNGDPAQITTNYTQLIKNDNVDLVMGTFAIPQNTAGARVAHQYGIPYVDPTSGTTEFYQQNLNNLFAVSLAIPQYLESFVNYLMALPVNTRPKTLAIAGNDDPFATAQVSDAINQINQIKGKPLQIVLNEPPYQAETTDFNPLAQQIVNSQADVVILGTTAPNQCVGFIKAFKQQHYNPKALLCTSGPDQGAAFIKPIGAQTAEGVFVPNGAWYPTIKSFGNDEFVKAYLAKYNGAAADISSDTVQSYSAGQVLEQAVKKVNSIDHTKLIQELSSDIFDSLQGAVKFDSTGKNIQATAFLYQLQNSTLVAVYPANQAQANPEYPKPHWS